MLVGMKTREVERYLTNEIGLLTVAQSSLSHGQLMPDNS